MVLLCEGMVAEGSELGARSPASPPCKKCFENVDMLRSSYLSHTLSFAPLLMATMSTSPLRPHRHLLLHYGN